MTRQQLVDLPASVTRRLLNLAHAQDEDFSLLLIRYASERLWQAFVKRSSLESHGLQLAEVVDALCVFLLPPLGAAHDQRFDKYWSPGGRWD